MSSLSDPIDALDELLSVLAAQAAPPDASPPTRPEPIAAALSAASTGLLPYTAANLVKSPWLNADEARALLAASLVQRDDASTYPADPVGLTDPWGGYAVRVEQWGGPEPTGEYLVRDYLLRPDTPPTELAGWLQRPEHDFELALAEGLANPAALETLLPIVLDQPAQPAAVLANLAANPATPRPAAVTAIREAYSRAGAHGSSTPSVTAHHTVSGVTDARRQHLPRVLAAWLDQDGLDRPVDAALVGLICTVGFPDNRWSALLHVLHEHGDTAAAPTATPTATSTVAPTSGTPESPDLGPCTARIAARIAAAVPTMSAPDRADLTATLDELDVHLGEHPFAEAVGLRPPSGPAHWGHHRIPTLTHTLARHLLETVGTDPQRWADLTRLAAALPAGTSAEDLITALDALHGHGSGGTDAPAEHRRRA